MSAAQPCRTLYNAAKPRGLHQQGAALYNSEQLQAHGMPEMMALLSHYGTPKKLRDGTTVQAMVEHSESLVEFGHFKNFLHGIVKDPMQTFLKPDGSVGKSSLSL